MTYSVRSAPAGLFLSNAVLDALGAGLLLVEPVYAAHDPAALVGLRYVAANAVAQRLLGLPDQLTGCFDTSGPQEAALFAFCQDLRWLGDASPFAPGYVAADGTHWQVVAYSQETHLLLSFIQRQERTAPVPSQPVARTLLQQVVAQTPAAIGILQGPDHRFEYVNPAFSQLFANRPLQGLPVAVGLPEAVDQGFIAQLDRVYTTGEPFYGTEVLVSLTQPNGQPPAQRYFNFICQAHSLDGSAERLSLFAYDVSEQVRARQELQRLNTELESRVGAGLADAQQARTDAERRRERLERFFEQAPIAICVLDGPDLVYELVNSGYQALFPGRPLLGLPVLDALPEIKDQPVWQQLYQVYTTGETHVETSQLIPLAQYSGGPLRDCYLHYVQQARYDANGRIDGVLVMVLDITAQVRVQQQAERLQEEVLRAVQRRAEEREAFYQIFEQTPAFIALMRGPEHHFEYVNPAYQALFPGRPLRGLPVLDALPETGPQGFVDLLEQVYRTGETFVGTELPLMITSSAGAPPQEKHLSFTYQAYREKGAIVGVSVFATDVSEQVRARLQREAGLQQLHTIFEQAPVGLALLQGPDYVAEVANPAICQMWGREQVAVLGHPMLEVLPEVVDQGIPELLAEVWRTGQPFVAEEHPVQLRRRGQLETVYFQFVCQPLTDTRDQVTAVVVVATDVSARVVARHQLAQANEELRTSNTQLTHTNTDLDNFIYTASHDLKAPIANIESLLLMLRQQLPPAARQAGLVPRVLRMMQESVERFRLTIAQLTDLSRLQQVRAAPGQAVDLAAVVEAVRLDLASMLEATGTRLTVAIDADATVQFAPQHLRSIIYNLLSNAVKYRHPDRAPLVQLRCRRAEANTVLEVQDNGLGLSEKQQDKLFTLFQRLHAHVEGSGVGLYMVKRIVENAGGTIRVQSELGVGSTFSVRFPA